MLSYISPLTITKGDPFMFHQETAQKEAEYRARLEELKTVFSQARTASLTLQIREEVEEIQAWFLRKHLEVPTFDFTQEDL